MNSKIKTPISENEISAIYSRIAALRHRLLLDQQSAMQARIAALNRTKPDRPS